MQRRGYTLTEILIVIGLIVLIMALAVPAFSFISGSRSVDAGENLVSAMLSRARAEAIRSRQTAGVAFFREQSTDRSAMSVVVPAANRSSQGADPPGLEEYKGWRRFEEDGTTPTHYEPGDIAAVFDTDTDVTITPQRKTTQLFVCLIGHNSSATTYPPKDKTDWGTISEGEFDTLVGLEYQYLPSGVGAQTINDPDPTNSNTMHDRYLRNGLILFDGDGNLVHKQYIIKATLPTDTDDTHLFRLMGFSQRNPPLNQTSVGANATYPLYSQMGVVLYDEEQFRGNGGSQDDPTNDNLPMTTAEIGEEKWLDNNCLSLMVNRYNGTLIRGE